MEEAERELIQRLVRENDPEAFSSIMSHYAAMVYSTCCRILRNDTQAEDATQETFFHLLKNAHRVTGSLGGWLHQVATRRAVDLVRQKISRQRREDAYATNDINRADQWSDIEPLVDEALEELPLDMREILVLHFLENQTLSQIAASRKISQPTVSRKMAAALEELRKKLRAQGIAVSLAGLGMMLAHSTQAAPAALLLGMGKMVMVQAASVSMAGSTAPWLVSAGVKVALSSAIAVLIAVAGWKMTRPGSSPSSLPPSHLESALEVPPRVFTNPSPEKTAGSVNETDSGSLPVEKRTQETPQPILLAQNLGTNFLVPVTGPGRSPGLQNSPSTQSRAGTGMGGNSFNARNGNYSVSGGGGMGGAGFAGRGGWVGGGLVMGPGGSVIASNPPFVLLGSIPGNSNVNWRTVGSTMVVPQRPVPGRLYQTPGYRSSLLQGRASGGGTVSGGNFSFGGGGGGGGSAYFQGSSAGGMIRFTTNYSYKRTFFYSNGKTQETQSFMSSGSTNLVLPSHP